MNDTTHLPATLDDVPAWLRVQARLADTPELRHTLPHRLADLLDDQLAERMADDFHTSQARQAEQLAAEAELHAQQQAELQLLDAVAAMADNLSQLARQLLGAAPAGAAMADNLSQQARRLLDTEQPAIELVQARDTEHLAELLAEHTDGCSCGQPSWPGLHTTNGCTVPIGGVLHTVQYATPVQS